MNWHQLRSQISQVFQVTTHIVEAASAFTFHEEVVDLVRVVRLLDEHDKVLLL